MEMGGGCGPQQVIDLRDDQVPGLHRGVIAMFLTFTATIAGVFHRIAAIDADQQGRGLPDIIVRRPTASGMPYVPLTLSQDGPSAFAVEQPSQGLFRPRSIGISTVPARKARPRPLPGG